MSQYLKLEKYSFGIGDRFAHEAKAQLQACLRAASEGAEVIPVWNKSNREHNIIGSEPASTRAAADAAVKALDVMDDDQYLMDLAQVDLSRISVLSGDLEYLRASDASAGYGGGWDGY